MPAGILGLNKPGSLLGIRALSSGGGSSFVQTLSVIKAPTGFVFDHGVNAYDDATFNADLVQFIVPGLLPVLGKDDGAQRGTGASTSITYPAASAITGTGDFTIVGFAVVTNADVVRMYDDGGLGTSIVLSINGVQDDIDLTVGNYLGGKDNAGISDGRTHLYIVRRTSGLVELFLDGALIDSGNDTPRNIATTGLETTFSNGSPTIDELAWWRRALTDTEVEMLAAAANVLTSSTGLLSGEWIEQHLADFAFSDADLDTGWSKIDTPDLSTGDAALVLQQIAQAEDGMTFVNGEGALRHIGRNSYGLSVCTIGDTVDDDLSIIGAPEWSMDIDQVFNRIQVSKPGYPLVTADDLASQNAYGIRSLQWSAELLEASQMQDAADWLLARYKDPRLRVDTVEVQGGNWPILLNLELGDRVTVNHHPPGGTLLTGEEIIEHIEYNLAPDDWVVTLQLAPMPPVWILGDPVLGVLGTTTQLGW